MEENILGKRIKELREESNLNQIEFSKILNISNTTLSQYEAGNRVPSDEIKRKIADFFQVTIDYLLGRSNSRSSNGQKIVTKAYRNIDTSGLPEEDIRKVEEYVELLKKKYNPDGTLKK